MDNTCPDSFGPALIPESGTVCGPEPCATATSLIAFIVGASFTGLTVSRNVLVLVLVPSLTAIVTMLEPNRSTAGVRLKVRSGPVPSRTMLAGGMSVAFSAHALTVRFAGGVPAAPIVNDSGPATCPR